MTREAEAVSQQLWRSQHTEYYGTLLQVRSCVCNLDVQHSG